MEATCTDSVAVFECASVEVVAVAVEYDAELFHPWPVIERRNSNYSRVHKSSDSFFSKILEKPSIVQKKMIPHIKGLDFSQR